MNESQDTAATPQPEKPLSIFERKRQEMEDRHKQERDGLFRMINVFARVPESLAKKCNVQNCAWLDFDNLSREEAVEIMLVLNAGTWTKQLNYSSEALIDYEAVVDGVRVRLWAAAPPDSCRVIEVEEVIPATTMIRRKLVCSEKEGT